MNNPHWNQFAFLQSKGEEFPGLLPLISSYLSSVEVDADTHCTIHQYLRLIQKRANGELMTAAHWIREFVTTHPDYKYKSDSLFVLFTSLIVRIVGFLNRGDSVVSDKINYDLLIKMENIQSGTSECPSLLDHSRTKTRSFIPESIRNAENCTPAN